MTGTADFYVPYKHHSSSSLRAERANRPNTESQTVRVRTTTLDDHWQKVAAPGERVVLVKIDIEGAVDSVLPHSESVTRSQRPFFLIESHSLIEDTAISAMMQNLGVDTEPRTTAGWLDWIAFIPIPTVSGGHCSWFRRSMKERPEPCLVVEH